MDYVCDTCFERQLYVWIVQRRPSPGVNKGDQLKLMFQAVVRSAWVLKHQPSYTYIRINTRNNLRTLRRNIPRPRSRRPPATHGGCPHTSRSVCIWRKRFICSTARVILNSTLLPALPALSIRSALEDMWCAFRVLSLRSFIQQHPQLPIFDRSPRTSITYAPVGVRSAVKLTTMHTDCSVCSIHFPWRSSCCAPVFNAPDRQPSSSPANNGSDGPAAGQQPR